MARETSGDGELHFHYKRSERLGSDDNSTSEAPKGMFKRNRSLAIVLLDILLLLIMFLLLRFVFQPGAASKRIDDVTFTLNAFVFDAEVYATVEILQRRETGTPSNASSLVTVRFPDGSEATDVVPRSAGQAVRIRSVYATDPSEGNLPKVSVEVFALGNSFTLVVDATGE